MFLCRWCEARFSSTEGMTPVGGSHGHAQLFVSRDKQLAHDLREISDEQVEQIASGNDLLGQLMQMEPVAITQTQEESLDQLMQELPTEVPEATDSAFYVDIPPELEEFQ